MLWEAFKAYIRGILISQKAYVNKRQQDISKEMLKEITILETEHKETGKESIKEKLDEEIIMLKLVQAPMAAKSVMYYRQQYFEYRDKPNKLMARVLDQGNPRTTIPDVMFTKPGKKVSFVEDKLEVFTE